MAEEDAENAFLQAQAMNADSVDYHTVGEQGADISDTDDYDPSKTLQDPCPGALTDDKQDEHVSAPPSVPFDPNSSSQTPFQGPNPDQQAAGAAAQSTSRDHSQSATPMPTSGAPAQQKAKTIGGFVVDDDEDEAGDDKGEPDADADAEEDADYEPPGVLDTEDMDAPVSGTANQTSSALDVPSTEPAQDPASAKDVSHSSYSPAPKNDVSAAPGQSLQIPQAVQSDTAQNSAAPTPTPDAPSTSPPKGRLPHDRVGILEDRIQEDPRGDIQAWLDLINEHRSRNRIDNAREVYERFLKMFPLAVSVFCIVGTANAHFVRPNNGWHTPAWNPKSTSYIASSRSSTGPS